MTYRLRQECRMCGATTLIKVLDLPETPLANEFTTTPNVDQERFPLWLAACGECAHVQLPVVVDPERLFSEYVYVSGTSRVFRDHFQQYADALLAEHVRPGDLVVEIGSNDGTLLKCLQSAGVRVLGIEPAVAVAARANEEGIETWPEFFGPHTVDKCRVRGAVAAVIANNVFAHADDLRGIASEVKRLLKPDGVFVFEVSYLPDVLDGTLFDTCYHEHLSYHAVGPLRTFFASLGMSLVGARRVDTHGGSIRVTVRPTPYIAPHTDVISLTNAERSRGLAGPYGHDTALTFAAFQNSITTRREELRCVLAAAKASGGSIVGYGAPAKATTLLYSLGIEHGTLDFVVDDSPHKQGRWMPGGRIPVMPSSAIDERRPSHILILAWNFAESILDKLAPYRAAGGTCIVPLPTVRVLAPASGETNAPHDLRH